jgi:hypothetical protein
MVVIGGADFRRSASGAGLQRFLTAIVLARVERRLVHCLGGHSVAQIMPQGKRDARKGGRVNGSGNGCGCIEVKRNMQRMGES